MKPDWKKKWVTALRSGEYKQGQGLLRRREKGGDVYCCLGVLAHLVAPEEWSKNTRYNGAYLHNEGYQNLGYHIFEMVGLPPETSDHLVDMNDTGKRFTTIAKWIEENL